MLNFCCFLNVTSASGIGALEGEEDIPVLVQLGEPIFDPNFRQAAAAQGLDPNRAVAGYWVPFIVSSNNQNPQTNISDNIQSEIRPLEIGGNEYYLKNIKIIPITGNVISRVTGIGPAPLSMTVSESIQTTFSPEISSVLGWSGAQIASKLGITYQASRHFERTYGPIQIPAGKKYTIYCAPTYNLYEFEVWEDDWLYDDFIGLFEYRDPTGLYFYWQDETGW